MQQNIQNVPCLLQSNREISPVKPPKGYVLQKGVTINIVAPTVALPSDPDSPGRKGFSPRRTSTSSLTASPAPTPRSVLSVTPTVTPRPSPRTCGPLQHISPQPRLVQSFISRSADQLPGLTSSSFNSLTNCFGFGSPRPPSPAGPMAGRFEVRDLPLGFWPFDPNLPALRGQLLAALGASSSSRFEAMTGFHGGLNDGIWFLRGAPGETLVLKLVKYDRFAPPQLVEERIFSKLYQEVPHIAEDAHVAFPTKVFRLLGPNNVRKHDLFVMRKAPGKSLDHLISEKWRSNRKGDIMKIFAKVGECLAQFHRRYGGRQHNDAGTQNILYDEETQHVTFIDLGGMGNKTDKTDVQRLSQLVLKLSRCPTYGPDLAVAVDHFREGYNRALQTTLTL